MSIAPFPSQDLAKLVLGYLAEEQLMTAYDEFLQASPYLDALRNEYDRIFMTSLKSILAEYRAVKIYVETCSPLVLRKRLFQCPNLLEIVKFLINNVDITKLQAQEAAERASFSAERQNLSTLKSQICEECSNVKVNCICKSKVQACDSHSKSNADNTVYNSVETTPLADLPGNYVALRKKHVKVLEKDSTHMNHNVSSGQSSGSSALESQSSNVSSLHQTAHYNTRQHDVVIDVDEVTKYNDAHDSRQKIEEFNDVLKSVVNKQNMMPMTSFQTFATAVSAGEHQSANVPDSSTSENLNVHSSVTKDMYNSNMIRPPNCQIVLQVSQLNEKVEIGSCKNTSATYTSKGYPNILPKSDNQKIKILSDVKVGTKFKIKDNAKKTSALSKTATSTPLMQKIVINGASAYKRNPLVNQNYTKDEIMAMPTLIVVPASASSCNPTINVNNPAMTLSCNTQCNTVPSPKELGPLIIDVPSSPKNIPQNNNDLVPNDNETNQSAGLVKTVDVVRNATEPKDNGTSVPGKNNTPQGLLPVRKSSSTPRRTSHVRVLDFTTPRRILHNTINEQVTQSSEIVLSGSPNVTHTLTTAHAQSTQNTIVTYSAQNIECIEIKDGSSKENNTFNLVKTTKKTDWDADLRALAIATDSATSVPKTKKTYKNKKVKQDKTDSNKTKQKKTREKKESKKKRKVEEDEQLEEIPVKPDSSVKPTKPNIHITYSNDNQLSKSTNDSKTEKDNPQEINVESVENTPEGERLSLQNVIGAKLNISDLLETPYKQALYDIQMETPRFLGPELPGEPISDVKIMSIPTPRFLNTPKVVQATPSSYSSRPTDYSSGGSYYKPDDQDYVLIPELGLTEKPSKQDSDEKPKEKENKSTEKKQSVRKSRPVRQCTRNVSYRASRLSNKAKEPDDNTDTGSSCSESQLQEKESHSENSSNAKTPRTKTKHSNKTDCKKRIIRLQKSPLVKDKSKFINIKTNTPIKLTPPNRRRVSETASTKGKKKAISKDKKLNLTPLVMCAPPKSRRKSSTPRKLHCTKAYNSTSSTNNSELAKDRQTPNHTDSDTEQIALRWSDDGSQDGKVPPTNTSLNEGDDITQIKEFIESSKIQKDSDTSFKEKLVRRGFDLETAKIIERDLLEPNEDQSQIKTPPISVEIIDTKKEVSFEKTETDSSITNELHMAQDDSEESEEVELSTCECDDTSNNYYVFQHDDSKEQVQTLPVTLKDKFSMEVCIDEELTVRLRANPFATLFELEPLTEAEISYNYKETQMAVSSISNMHKLYTPIKDPYKAQYYEIFDSTLTSLDTPFKSPKKRDGETTVTEIVLEEEKNDGKTETKKRKRSQSSPDKAENKKTKNETQIDIKNIDIESVLTKLHGH